MSPVELNERGALDAASTITLSICKEMFLHFYRLSDARFRQLKEHCQNHGVSLRTQGNKKRLPHNTLYQASVKGVKAFLSNYVEENAICLPGRIPRFKSNEIKVLSSSETKKPFGKCMKRRVKLQIYKQLHKVLRAMGTILSQRGGRKAHD